MRYYTKITVIGVNGILQRIPARAELSVLIVLAGSMEFSDTLDSRRYSSLPSALLVGPHQTPGGWLRAKPGSMILVIQLQPDALHRLQKNDMRQMTGRIIDARPLLTATTLAQLFTATDDTTRVQMADLLATSLFGQLPAPDAVGRAARQLRDNSGSDRIEALAQISCLSHRQFQRRFAEHVGIAPKPYARLCRISSLIRTHADLPARPWVELAAEFGFADQSHLVRDFHALEWQSPRAFRCGAEF